MDKIPVELWVQIFRWCLPPFEFNHERYPLRARKTTPEYAPLLLCQVSSAWRTITLSASCLWTSLDVHVSYNVTRPSIELASLWLARSKSQPLSLELIQNSIPFETQNVLKLFQEHVSHWQYVRLSILDNRSCRQLESQRSAPMLKAFQTSAHITTGLELNAYFGFFEDVPQLFSLHLASMPNLNTLGRIAVSIPWPQLTHLTTSFASFHDAMQVLELCKNLVEFDMSVLDLRRIPVFEGRQIIQSTLSSLTICGSAHLLLLVFSNLCVPNLKTLVVSELSWGPVIRWSQEKLCPFLITARDIRQLELRNVGIAADTAHQAITGLQKLETLIITEDDTLQTWCTLRLDSLLKLLTCPDFSGGRSIVAEPCPNLETLVFNGSCRWSTEGILADMVESRWAHQGTKVAKLKRVDISVRDLSLFGSQDCRRLKEFEEEGLELILGYSYQH